MTRLRPWEPRRTSQFPSIAFEQRQNVLRRGIGLRQRRHSGLQQDLSFGQIGGFGGHIGVPDARFRSRFVGQLRLSQVDGVGEVVFTFADHGLGGAEICDRVASAVTAVPASAAVETSSAPPVPTSAELTFTPWSRRRWVIRRRPWLRFPRLR